MRFGCAVLAALALLLSGCAGSNAIADEVAGTEEETCAVLARGGPEGLVIDTPPAMHSGYGVDAGVLVEALVAANDPIAHTVLYVRPARASDLGDLLASVQGWRGVETVKAVDQAEAHREYQRLADTRKGPGTLPRIPQSQMRPRLELTVQRTRLPDVEARARRQPAVESARSASFGFVVHESFVGERDRQWWRTTERQLRSLGAHQQWAATAAELIDAGLRNGVDASGRTHPTPARLTSAHDRIEVALRRCT